MLEEASERVQEVKVGVPTEIKDDEYRVALTPAGVRELSEARPRGADPEGAGEGSAIADADYEAQGATILPDAEAVFGEAEMILKVKEPQLRRSRCCARARSCSPTSTSLPTPS